MKKRSHDGLPNKKNAAKKKSKKYLSRVLMNNCQFEKINRHLKTLCQYLCSFLAKNEPDKRVLFFSPFLLF